MRQDGSMPFKDQVFRAVTGLHKGVYNVSKGKVGGRGMGMPVVILTTTGRKSGQLRETMLTTPLIIGDKVTLIASFGGDDREPSWCLNIRKTAQVKLTMEGQTRDMLAHIADADERAQLWPQITSAHRNYAGYQTKTSREIPVVVLEPRP
jgi:deazaflavin-dependent oxidoreductase (nitroreductase family)